MKMVFTCVSLEYLHDLSALQIPEVDLVVFAAGYDPLSARDTKARCDAVLLISVTHVRLQTSRCLVVPKPYSAIMRG